MDTVITVLITLLLLATPLVAEQNNSSLNSGGKSFFKSESTRYWGGYGAGKSNDGFYHGGSLFLNRSRFLWRLFFSSSLYHENYYDQETGYSEAEVISFNSISLSGGVGFSRKSLNWGISAGPSFSWGEIVRYDSISEFESYGYLRSVAVPGIYGGTYLLFTPKRNFGVGIDGSFIINKEESVAGVLVTANIGKFGDQAVSQRKRTEGRQKRKARRQARRHALKGSPRYKRNAIGIGWSHYLWKRKMMGVVTTWDHPFRLGLFSVGVDASLFFGDLDTTIYYFGEIGKPDVKVQRISETTYLPIRFRLGFHPLNLPVFQEKRDGASAWDPYIVIRLGQELEWSTVTEKGVTTKEFEWGEGIFDGGGFWNIDSWGTVAAGIRWNFHSHIGLWGEIDWYRVVTGMSVTF